MSQNKLCRQLQRLIDSVPWQSEQETAQQRSDYDVNEIAIGM